MIGFLTTELCVEMEKSELIARIRIDLPENTGILQVRLKQQPRQQ
jgi:hypothetical protein